MRNKLLLPFLINFFSFLKISSLKFQAPKNTKSASFFFNFLYFLISILLPGKYLPILKEVVS